jgi:DNA-binding transcriptional LysR family regulator
MFDWNDLKYFLAVARAGTTLRAAKTLKVSQSTAARRIAALEKAIGVKLFDKRQSGYVPTEAGAALMETAERVEAVTGVFDAAASAHKRGLTGTVRFTCSEIAVSSLMMGAIGEFREAYPSVRLELITTDRKLDLAAGEADVAFRAGTPPTEPTLVGRRLAIETWSIYCTRSYAEKHGAPQAPEDLAHHAFFTLNEDFPRLPMIEWIERHVPESAIVMRQNTIGGLFGSLRSGLGVTVMSDFLASSDANLVRCFTPDVAVHSEIWLITHERLRKTPRVRALMDFLADYFAKGRHIGAAPPS